MGDVKLTGVPTGDYHLQVQHPRLSQPLERAITVPPEGLQSSVTLEELLPDPSERKPESELERLFDR